LQYPPNIKILRVMCSGRVEPGMVLKCFENGADGVMVLGCHIGDCHYRIGNRKAEARVTDTKRLLALMGISEGRLLLKWISASEGALFAETGRDFVERIRVLGPLKGGSE
jgi:F420-non-reducing hydrogenase iron-sulfur subunit